MWPRVVEVMLGCWLMVSPFVFRHSPEEGAYWLTDLWCGFFVLILALLSLWERLRLLHLGIGLVAAWLVGFGIFAAPHPAPPALQNDIAVGLLLLMFAILPNDASLPPRGWRDFHSGKMIPPGADPQHEPADRDALARREEVEVRELTDRGLG